MNDIIVYYQTEKDGKIFSLILTFISKPIFGDDIEKALKTAIGKMYIYRAWY